MTKPSTGSTLPSALIKDLIHEYMQEKQASIIVSSHDLHELEGLCDHFGLINGKKLVMDSSISELSENRAKFGSFSKTT